MRLTCLTSRNPNYGLASLISCFLIRKLPAGKWASINTATQVYQYEQDSLPPLRSLLDNRLHQQPNRTLEFALVSALKLCSAIAAIVQGVQIHSFVLTSGLSRNSFILNSLINMYVKCGDLSVGKFMFDSCSDSVSCNIMICGYVRAGKMADACKLFDEMPAKGCVSYTSMILGFSQNGQWLDVLDMFTQMRIAGVIPNEVTLATVISACSHISWILDCKLLHGLIIKMMFVDFVLVSTNLVHMYCVCSCLRDARALFEEMTEKNTISWNVLLNGYSKAGLVNDAVELFNRMPNRDAVSWCTIINAYVQAERLNQAFMMYRSMVAAGWELSEVLLVDLISACARKMAIREGKQLHGVAEKMGFNFCNFVQSKIIHFYACCLMMNEASLQFELGLKDHVASWNALMGGFIRNGMITKARKSFEEMPERDVFSWSIMISGYVQNQQPEIGLELFHLMDGRGFLPNDVTMVSVLSAISSLGRLNEGIYAHEYIMKNSIAVSDNLSAALIDMYAKCGSIEKALEVFNGVRERACTASPWNTIICGLAIHGHANLSLALYLDLETRNIKLNAITFIGVLSACGHGGMVELGKRYFREMKSKHGVDADIRHYGCMVDLLGRAGKLREAEEVIMNMPMAADVIIWGTLLAACRTHGNVDVAERAAENLAKLEPCHAASRVLLCNIYANAGRWADAYWVRKCMQGDKLLRIPGYSGVKS